MKSKNILILIINWLNDFFLEKHPRLSIILLFQFVTTLLSIAFYPILPQLLNYPPDINTISQKLVGVTYFIQYFTIMLIAVFISSIFLYFLLKPVKNYRNLRDLIRLPYLIYICQILYPTLVIGFFLILLAVSSELTVLMSLRITAINFPLYTFVAIIDFIFSRNIFNNILLTSKIK